MRTYADSLPTKPHYAKNRCILKWWNNGHDELLLSQIKRDHWIWFWNITDVILANTPESDIENWRNEDPICAQYAWYNVLMNFAAARANQLGFTQFIRKPEQKTCALCKNIFSEDTIPPSVVRHLGINRIDVCSECIGCKFGQGSGSDELSEDKIIKYLRDLVDVIQVIPPQNFGETLSSLTHLSTEQRVAVLYIGENKPTIRRVKEVFGSWLNALIQAGVLEDGTRKTSRGIHCIAKDGHVCLSLGEKTIDDYLFSHGIIHEKEPRYPEGNYRGDFKVGTTFIEYFGLTGNPDYDAKTKEKIRLCKKHSIVLVAIYSQDLVSQQKLESKLSALITKA
jgi:hypothetical protein